MTVEAHQEGAAAFSVLRLHHLQILARLLGPAHPLCLHRHQGEVHKAGTRAGKKNLRLEPLVRIPQFPPELVGEHVAVGDVDPDTPTGKMRGSLSLKSIANSSSNWWRRVPLYGITLTTTMQTFSELPNRREITSQLFDTWGDLSMADQRKCVKKVITWWRSIRDRFKREYNLEVQAPSGSGETSRPPYMYTEALGFLRRMLALRRTARSTRMPEPPLEEDSTQP
ncbi:uncharacterized protein LOC122927982 [Bufo gargarizans]|uniref:uncharacterized protein LOC122927982 n=1 Tax=Bufo gargarizans TaxID=30331 RepID=UPI001CF27C12|nr:uncharacterized protein LOC122927982 [Bufo gargarizans]